MCLLAQVQAAMVALQSAVPVKTKLQGSNNHGRQNHNHVQQPMVHARYARHGSATITLRWAARLSSASGGRDDANPEFGLLVDPHDKHANMQIQVVPM